jgi:hypothetical protein
VNEHLVSRVLLRQFQDKKGDPISGLDLDTLVIRKEAVEKFGSIKGLLTHPGRLEQMWNKEVEMRLPYAFELIEQKKLFDNPEAVRTIKNCIALHWARAFSITELIKRLQVVYANQVATRLLSQVTPAQAIEAMTGLTVTGLGAYDIARSRIVDAFDQHLKSEHFLEQQFIAHYNAAKGRVDFSKLEVWEATTSEFLMADIPVVTWDKAKDVVGVLNGANWGNTDVIYMSLGPKYVVALSKEYRYYNAGARAVEGLNVLQIRGAYKEVYFRAASDLGTVITKALRQSRAKRGGDKPGSKKTAT